MLARVIQRLSRRTNIGTAAYACSTFICVRYAVVDFPTLYMTAPIMMSHAYLSDHGADTDGVKFLYLVIFSLFACWYEKGGKEHFSSYNNDL